MFRSIRACEFEAKLCHNLCFAFLGSISLYRNLWGESFFVFFGSSGSDVSLAWMLRVASVQLYGSI